MEDSSSLLVARGFGRAGAADVNERLYAIGMEMARLVMPQPYCGPPAT
jgi:hypothetical protein